MILTRWILRSLSQDELSDVSSKAISFQIDLHPLNTLVKSLGLFQEYRVFEDMLHGITINREFGKKLKLHICTLDLRSSKVFVSDVKCMRCYVHEHNLRRFDFLRHIRFNWCKKFQFLSVTLTDSFLQVIIDNLFTISCSFFVSSEVHQHELVRIENLSS